MSKEDRYSHLNGSSQETTDDSNKKAILDGQADNQEQETLSVDAEPDSSGDADESSNQSTAQSNDGVSVTVQDGETEYVVELDQDEVTVNEVLEALKQDEKMAVDADTEMVHSEADANEIVTSLVKAQQTAAVESVRMALKGYKKVFAGTLVLGSLWLSRRRKKNKQ